MKIDQALKTALAPIGKLRASINLGNPILAGSDPASGRPFGLSVDLAHALAQRLELPLELIVVDTALKSVNAVTNQEADVGFFAIDPLRGEAIAFTAPYLLIEGCYLVREDSSLLTNEEVDQPGLTVAVGKGSAYDLYLTRSLARAEIVRAPTSQTVVDTFVGQHIDVAAGVRQQLELDARRIGGLRLLPGRFMVIRQAMGIPKSRGEPAEKYLASWMEEMKVTGFVQQSLATHDIGGATVAGPGHKGE